MDLSKWAEFPGSNLVHSASAPVPVSGPAILSNLPTAAAYETSGPSGPSGPSGLGPLYTLVGKK
jgi:hypothetical protein